MGPPWMIGYKCGLYEILAHFRGQNSSVIRALLDAAPVIARPLAAVVPQSPGCCQNCIGIRLSAGPVLVRDAGEDRLAFELGEAEEAGRSSGRCAPASSNTKCTARAIDFNESGYNERLWPRPSSGTAC